MMEEKVTPAEEALPSGPEAQVGSEALEKRLEEVTRERDALAAEKEALLQSQSAALREAEEFRSAFPDVSLSEIPDSVKTYAGKGVPLAAAYALYLHSESVKKAAAEEASRKANETSWGSVAGGSTGGFYTPEEVKKMSREEVRDKFDLITESMKHWKA